jgi:hypothetical protein|tara:strand:- start:181 stop:480 length:300 start_codon:yes stop_codon:yes gene_type:complete
LGHKDNFFPTSTAISHGTHSGAYVYSLLGHAVRLKLRPLACKACLAFFDIAAGFVLSALYSLPDGRQGCLIVGAQENQISVVLNNLLLHTAPTAEKNIN